MHALESCSSTAIVGPTFHNVFNSGAHVMRPVVVGAIAGGVCPVQRWEVRAIQERDSRAVERGGICCCRCNVFCLQQVPAYPRCASGTKPCQQNERNFHIFNLGLLLLIIQRLLTKTGRKQGPK